MHVRQKRKAGVSELIGPGAKEITLSRLIFDPDDRETISLSAREGILVLLDGEVTFESAGSSWSASRTSPFDQRASALYLPPGGGAMVIAEKAAEVVLVTAAAEGSGDPLFVAPEDVKVATRGRDGFERQVHDILVHDDHAKRLLLGETINPPGKWSSFPPHKHDGEDGEPYLEEVYYYRTNPPQGFGYQALYSADGNLDLAYTVRDGDAVLISRGYHPVAAAPGYELYYLWALAGAERKLALHEDPEHSWLQDAPA